MRRPRSPEPERGRSTIVKSVTACSPPKPLFDSSARRLASPQSDARPISPPPSRRGSLAQSPNLKPLAFGTAFLGHRPQFTHTSSLPRSPNPFQRRAPSVGPSRLKHKAKTGALQKEAISEEDEDDYEEDDMPYTRGAIDIVQSLERCRLRRRQKFMEKYCSHNLTNLLIFLSFTVSL